MPAAGIFRYGGIGDGVYGLELRAIFKQRSFVMPPQLPGCPATELLGSWPAGRPFGLLTVGRAARSVAGGRPSEAPLDGPQQYTHTRTLIRYPDADKKCPAVAEAYVSVSALGARLPHTQHVHASARRKMRAATGFHRCSFHESYATNHSFFTLVSFPPQCPTDLAVL